MASTIGLIFDEYRHFSNLSFLWREWEYTVWGLDGADGDDSEMDSAISQCGGGGRQCAIYLDSDCNLTLSESLLSRIEGAAAVRLAVFIDI